MSLSSHTVLVEIVREVDTSGEPVPTDRLAESLTVAEPTLAETLASLQECELVKATDSGYRPTVTARELLALDIDLDDVLVVDVLEE